MRTARFCGSGGGDVNSCRVPCFFQGGSLIPEGGSGPGGGGTTPCEQTNTYKTLPSRNLICRW